MVIFSKGIHALFYNKYCAQGWGCNGELASIGPCLTGANLVGEHQLILRRHTSRHINVSYLQGSDRTPSGSA